MRARDTRHKTLSSITFASVRSGEGLMLIDPNHQASLASPSSDSLADSNTLALKEIS